MRVYHSELVSSALSTEVSAVFQNPGAVFGIRTNLLSILLTVISGINARRRRGGWPLTEAAVQGAVVTCPVLIWSHTRCLSEGRAVIQLVLTNVNSASLFASFLFSKNAIVDEIVRVFFTE